MGQMRFLTPPPLELSDEEVRCAYLAGMDAIPWRSFNSREGHVLTVERDLDDSGNLYIPWHVEGHGRFVLSTASLMERARPYNLPVELARGTLHRLLGQASLWEHHGMKLPEEYRRPADAAMRSFIQSATSQSEPSVAAGHAQQALRYAFDAIRPLMDHYLTKSLAGRRDQEPQMSTFYAFRCHGLPAQQALLTKAFNSAAVELNWRTLEPNSSEYDWSSTDAMLQWCHSQQLRVCGGPLLQLDLHHVPDWLYLWEDDFEQLEAYLTGFIRETVQRYRGNVHVWHGAARLNVPGALSLSEEDTIRMAVIALETIRRFDPRTPVIISFDQPWAEYLSRDNRDLTPLHFADALVRAELGISGIGLEINMGYWPSGTLPRDLLEINQQLERWSLFGLPLLIMLTVPSCLEHDPSARQQPWLEANPPSPEERSAAVERLVSLILSKQSVHGLVWNQLHDAGPHEFAHGGLLDSAYQPKLVLQTLARLRKQYLG